MSWVWYAIINAVAIAAVGLLQKRTLREEHSLEFVTMTAGLRLVLFYAIFWRTISWSVSTTEFLFLCLASILAGSAFWMVSRALRRQENSVVFPLLATEPGLTALFAVLLLHDTISLRQLLGLLVMVGGAYALELSVTHRDHIKTDYWAPFRQMWKEPGTHFALLATAIYAVSSVNDRFLLKSLTWSTYLAYGLPLMTLFYLLMMAIRRVPFTVFQKGRGHIWPWLILVSAVYLVSNVSNSHAVSMVAVGLVVAVKRSAVFLDVLLSGKLFHEQHTLHRLAASAAIVGGVVLMVT